MIVALIVLGVLALVIGGVAYHEACLEDYATIQVDPDPDCPDCRGTGTDYNSILDPECHCTVRIVKNECCT